MINISNSLIWIVKIKQKVLIYLVIIFSQGYFLVAFDNKGVNNNKKIFNLLGNIPDKKYLYSFNFYKRI